MPRHLVSVNSARFIYRVVYILLLIIGGILLAYVLRMALGHAWILQYPGKAVVRLWMRLVNNCLGIKVIRKGKVSSQSTLLVANHISWLDIVVIGSVIPCSFVSKQEVKDWPFIGHLARLSGTLFLKRGSPASLRRSIDSIQEIFSSGNSVAIFPEGTTSDGHELLPFHGGLFKAAIGSGVPVQPIAIRYYRNGKIDAVAPFIGETTFLEHIIKLMWTPETNVIFDMCELIFPESSYAELSKRSHFHISKKLAGNIARP